MSAVKAARPFTDIVFITPRSDVTVVADALRKRAQERGLQSNESSELLGLFALAAARLTARSSRTARAEGSDRCATWVSGSNFRVGVFMRERAWSAMSRARVRLASWRER